MLIVNEMTLEETILEKCEITEIKILEVNTEEILEMTILKEVEVDLGKDNIQVILEGLIEIVIAGLDQAQEPVLVEIKLDASSVENMIILLRTHQLHK